MSVEHTNAYSGPLYANGVTTVFPFDFHAASAAEVSVEVDGLPLDISEFVVALSDDGTGDVTITPALASGVVYIRSAPDFTQLTSFQRFGPFYPDQTNAPLDRSAIRDIYLKDKVDRTEASIVGITDALELEGVTPSTLRADLLSTASGDGAGRVSFAPAAVYGAGSVGLELQGHMERDVPGASNQGFDFRLMETVESIDGTSAGAGKIDALRVAHTFGGSTAKGGRHAIESFCVIISPTANDNPDRNYVGGAFTGLATSSDGGGVGAERGALFGVNGCGRLGADATNWLNVTGAEFNTECVAGSSVAYKSGIQICGFATDTVQGSEYDAMISLSRQNGGTIFRDGILFSAANGLAPVGTGSTLLRTQGAATIDSGIDVGSYLFTKQAIRIGATSAAQQAGIGIRQQANGSVSLFLQRNTDSAPTGNIIQIVNAANSAVLFSVDASGNVVGGNVTTALVANGSGTIAIGDASGEVQMNKPLVAPGGGAAASLGSIGGSGPVTANQNSWMRFLDQSGALCWVPVWK